MVLDQISEEGSKIKINSRYVNSRLNSEYPSYDLVHNILYSSLVSRNLRNKVYEAIILAVVCGRKTWLLPSENS
jgi:hypothetical protein